MKTIYDYNTLEINQKALSDLKKKINQLMPVESYILFGSAARGDTDVESDIDILILSSNKLSFKDRNKITDIIFYINLRYDANFSATAIDLDTWENGIVSVLPFHDEVERDGIVL